jgi:hypothetical protein
MQVQYHQQKVMKMLVLAFVGIGAYWQVLRGIGHKLGTGT